MAAPEKDGKSDAEEVISKIKTGAKVAAFGGLSALVVAAKAVSSGATVVQKTAAKARNGMLK
ncbi:MAG TPA: hypothetical protein VIM31_03950 [Candidatus Microsaccharimonas sp.]|jgi:preprotein translocase subunit YajC